MISRFYYSLTAPKEDTLSNTENEFGITLATTQGPFNLWNRYAPVDNQNGIIWLIEQLTDRTSLIPADTDITKKLLKHIWLNLYDKNVAYLDIKHPRWEHPSKPFSGDDYTSMRHELGNSIWSIYLDTKDRYEKLIGIYEDELDNLMKPMESNSETRFNDTPQNAVVNPDTYTADNYTTTITSTKASTDLTSKMNRIDEVQRLLKNLYSDWAFEFNKLICED